MHKSYGALEVLRGVDSSVDTGEVAGYLGSNGASKLTTLNIHCSMMRDFAGYKL
ncbi:MAG: hypothetical protein LBV41_08005 [Cytophagaceae bacterium]|jgi:ABC-type multidrug transport system ATPase subunit|nr:hypothetical protein [Cytophagaceae bacterium]